MEFSAEIIEKAKKIRLLALDVDGVLTDGGIYIGGAGELFKRFDIKDGLAIMIWNGTGGRSAIITGRESSIVRERAKELGVTYVRQGRLKKIYAYDELKSEAGVSDEEIAFIGDDLVDIPILRRAGLAIAVSDAAKEAADFADIITRSPGGRGAVREAVELILKAQGKWEEILKVYVQ